MPLNQPASLCCLFMPDCLSAFLFAAIFSIFNFIFMFDAATHIHSHVYTHHRWRFSNSCQVPNSKERFNYLSNYGNLRSRHQNPKLICRRRFIILMTGINYLRYIMSNLFNLLPPATAATTKHPQHHWQSAIDIEYYENRSAFCVSFGLLVLPSPGKLYNENVNQFSHDLPAKSMSCCIAAQQPRPHSHPDIDTHTQTYIYVYAHSCLSHSMPIANWVHLLAANIDMTDTFLFYFICIFISLFAYGVHVRPSSPAPDSSTDSVFFFF